MTEEEKLRQELQAMILELGGDDMAAALQMPMAFALACCEVAHARGVNAGLRQASDKIAAHFAAQR